MERSDFIQRGEIKVDFLKYYRLVSRWAIQNTDLKVADLELLFYLDPIVYFTIDDFKTGTLFYLVFDLIVFKSKNNILDKNYFINR